MRIKGEKKMKFNQKFFQLFINCARYLFQPEDSFAGGTMVGCGTGHPGRLCGVLKALLWIGAAVVAGVYIGQL
jgi:hypothetical protein